MATYVDAASASDRLAVVTGSAQTGGAVVGTAVVPGADAVLVSGPADTTLVAVLDSRTYALTLVPGLLDAAGTQAALQMLAAAAVEPAG